MATTQIFTQMGGWPLHKTSLLYAKVGRCGMVLCSVHENWSIMGPYLQHRCHGHLIQTDFQTFSKWCSLSSQLLVRYIKNLNCQCATGQTESFLYAFWYSSDFQHTEGKHSHWMNKITSKLFFGTLRKSSLQIRRFSYGIFVLLTKTKNKRQKTRAHIL